MIGARLAGLGTFAFASLAGGLAFGAVLWTVGEVIGPLPHALVVGTAVVVGAVCFARLPLLSSPWRVPREWNRFGRVGYAAAFGFALGTGVLTALPSAGLILIGVWSASGVPLHEVGVVWGTFAAARVLTTASASGRSYPAVVDRLGQMGAIARKSALPSAALSWCIALTLVL